MLMCLLKVLFFVKLFIIARLPVNASNFHVISVFYDTETAKFTIEEGTLPDRVAWANFTNAINESGWSFLNIVTNETFPDEIQAYAAGLAEGHLTAELLKNHFMNLIDGICDNYDDDFDPLFCDKLWDFLHNNTEWMKKNIENHKSRPLWHQVNLILKQLQGLQDGCQEDIFNVTRHRVLKDFGFLAFADMEDLQNVFGNKSQKDNKLGSCSALIKLLPENSDLYISHDTWVSYSAMTRCLKRYEFYYHVSPIPGSFIVPGHTMTFSSYPGALQSVDDFYIIANTELVVLETTLDNFNENLWKLVKPESLLVFFRNMYANRIAEDGQSWVAAVSLHQNGVYNNEWMVVDFKKFRPYKEAFDGLLWVVEELPGHSISEDMSEVLKQQTYWASYNLPYFPYINELSGTKNKSEKAGSHYSYENSSRAQIFRRDHHQVVDLESMSKLMRSNDYQTDPLSICDCDPPIPSAMNAIAARGDLNPPKGNFKDHQLQRKAVGATDMKITNYQMMKSLQFLAYSGPTFEQQAPFQWSKYENSDNKSHFGQPDLWNFSTILVSWD